MSVLTNRRRRRQTEEVSDPLPARARKRRPWRLGVFLLILATLAWLLPDIVAHTPLLPWALTTATADLEGDVSVRSASLGWLSPIELKGIEVRDANGKPVLEAGTAKSDKSLAAILSDLSQLGEFRLEQPKLNVVLRDDGSNLEDLLAAYLVPSEEPSRPVDFLLRIIDGSVSLTDQNSQQTWRIEQLDLSLSMSAEAEETLQLKTSAVIADPSRPGRLDARLTMRQTDAGEIVIDAGEVPLAMFDAILGRFEPQTQLGGWLSAKLDAQWGGEAAAGKTVVRADVTTEDLALATPRLGTDRVQLKHVHATAEVTRQDDRIHIKQSSLDCDLGNVSMAGTLDFGNKESGQLLSSLLHQPQEINGRIDLARLARMLPETLHIRKETQITSGQVQLALSSRPNSQRMGWQAHLEASDLTAVYQNRQLAWEKPILLTMTAYESSDGLIVEDLKCESSFLKLHAAGTTKSLAAAASFNLSELADQLGQFVDLDGLGLSGEGWAHLNWEQPAGRQFETDAELQLRNFQLAISGGQAWTEENLLVFFSADGQTDFSTDTQLQHASLQIKVGADQIDARLTQPVLDMADGGTWPLDVRIKGQLAHWPDRLRTWIALDEYGTAGAYELTIQATGSAAGVTVRQAKLVVQQLQVQTPWLIAAEPNVQLVASGGWDQKQRRLQVDQAVLTGSSLTLQAERVVLTLPEEGPLEMAGVVKYQGDLQPLSQWFAERNAPPAWRVAGQLAGTADVRHSAALISARVNADVSNLLLTDSSGQRIHEPLVHLAATGDYQHETGTVRIEHAELVSQTLGADTEGQITLADDRTDVQLTGQLKYDLEKLCGLFRPYVGPGVRMAGRGTRAASYRGSLSPAKAQATAGLSWQWADVYGFQVGPGDLKLALGDGVLKAEPMDLTVNRGRLLLSPEVQLATDPIQLTLPPGPLAQQVQITPAMCETALKYIAPVLAGVATAQGSFSIELDGCRVPLSDPGKSEVAGKFTVHSVQIGPGPLVRELTVLLGRASPAQLRRESVVAFRMVDGRVYHQGLELIFPDLTIRTHGSVGLDQTLALMAVMPIPPKWLGNNQLAEALRGQTIELPIGGTLSKPRIDRRKMDEASRKFIGNAARNVLENEVNKQLHRLFAPP